MFGIRERFGLIAVALLIACSPAAPTPAGPVVPPREERADVQSITVAIGAIPVNMTPQSGFRDLFQWLFIYDSLTEIGKNFEVLPSLAEKWDLSADGTLWTFTIRRGVTFSNGDPVTAEDVAFSFNEASAKAWPTRTFFATVTDAKALDETRVEVKTRAPDMSIPAGTQYVLVVPKKYYESVGGFDGFRDKPIGSGPYVVSEFVPQSRVAFKKRSEPHGFRKVQADEIIVREIPDHSQKINGMRTGQVDVIAPSALSTDQIQAAETSGLKYQIVRNAFIFLSIPQGTAELKKSPLTDKRVRLALNYAIDKEAISKSLYRGFSQPLGQLALPGSLSWDPSVQPVYDLARSKQLLTEAGHPDGIKIPLTVDVSQAQNLNDLLLAIQANWKQLGVTLEINLIDAGLYNDKVYGRNNQQKSDFIISGNGDTNGFFTAVRAIYGCGRPIGSPPSALYYCNPEWDRLLDAGLAERDPARRSQQFRDANRIIREEAGMIPLFAPASFFVQTPKIAGIDVTDRTQFTLDGIYKIK